MPPMPFEYQGRDAVASFLRALYGAIEPGRWQLAPTRANAQPAFATFLDAPDDGAPVARATGLLVLTLAGDRISALTRFDASALRRFEPAGTPRED